MSNSPFDLHHDAAYQHWREDKLATAPTDLGALIVEIGDPRQLTASEHAAILERCRLANMAIYVGTTGDDPSKGIPAALGAHFGLHRLDHNRGADDDAITSLTVQTDVAHREYIPYSNRAIDWHTDGYYNAPERQIHGLLLHCVHPAADGGENALLDHEILYIQIRDHNPEFIRALMQPDCMSIPAHHIDGEEIRPHQPGPVFSVGANGALHMRYTNRARNIVWRDDPLTAAAVSYLKNLLRTPSPWHFLGKLQAGWGLISNNVLHTRTGFNDDATPRLLYRARYYDRIAGC
ncbi:TauD/TfdA family dioxygenase [Chromatium okenii]|uniref:Taurine catabolism dioxygenase TauD n=1 Tax=Chromatium okenii TaxID=61644 RepID=A0A2S7XP18_9GAMM|nr:TauD/TfdA family dioxygenase [Chromatium okenii]MBV5308135.1 TauD/TfdA family dioxygenase [Chromatium okenii]PQJ95480.1 taurine catabolism dioxygenase TauD [Chromatium okenii]